MKKLSILILLFTITICISAKTWVREYTYQASEADSKLTSRAISLEQVKRLLLQEIGVYIHASIISEEVETSGEVKELTAKQIEIVSAGITETKIIEENWNGETYYIKAEISADENDVIKRLDKVIEDKEKTKQLEESHQKTEEALAEIERLKQQLSQTQDDNEKLQLQSQYNQSSNQLTAEDWFQKGRNSNEIGDFDNAILYWQKTINMDPEHEEAYSSMGLAYSDKEKYDKAIECYEKAIEIDPNSASWNLYYMLSAFKNIDDKDEIIKCYHKIIEFDKNDKDALCPGLFLSINYSRLGGTYYYNGNYDKAIEFCQKSIDIDPEDFTAHLVMGYAYEDKNNYDKAIECYLKAINIDPENSILYFFVGFAYHAIDNLDKALEYYQQTIEINPSEAEAHSEMASIYFKMNDIEKGNNSLIKAARFGHKRAQDYLKTNGISW